MHEASRQTSLRSIANLRMIGYDIAVNRDQKLLVRKEEHSVRKGKKCEDYIDYRAVLTTYIAILLYHASILGSNSCLGRTLRKVQTKLWIEASSAAYLGT